MLMFFIIDLIARNNKLIDDMIDKKKNDSENEHYYKRAKKHVFLDNVIWILQTCSRNGIK